MPRKYYVLQSVTMPANGQTEPRKWEVGDIITTDAPWGISFAPINAEAKAAMDRDLQGRAPPSREFQERKHRRLRAELGSGLAAKLAELEAAAFSNAEEVNV